MSDSRRFAVVILAAGQGTRMRSDTHKVLHPIASRPMLLHLLDRVDGLGADKSGRRGRQGPRAGRSGARRAATPRSPSRPSRRAPRHAVQQAADALAGYDGAVLILYGDTPFVEAATLRRMLDRLDGDGGPGVVVLASRPADPASLWPDHPRRRRPYRQDGRISRRDRGGAGGRPVQFGHDGAARGRPVPLARPRSATTMPRANIICPTSSTSPPRRAATRW